MSGLGAQTARGEGVRPVRAIGRWSLTAVGVNGIIGAGIYTLPATVAATLGPSAVPAYLVAAAIVLTFGYCMAILGRQHELSGGPYVYVAEVFGPFAGFQVGWFFLLARLTALGAVTNVFVSYFARFFPSCSSGVGRAAAITLCLAALAAINVAGIRDTALAMNAFAIGKILPLFAFAAVGAFFADWSRLAITRAPAPQEFGHSLLLLVFAFGGFEFLTVPAEECRRPTEHVPFALLASIACTSALYISVQAVTLGVAVEAGGHQDALSFAAAQFSGTAGALVMAAGATISTTGTNLATILVTSRLFYAFARDGRMPGWLGTLHPRFRTPVVAIVLVTAAGTLLALSGSFARLAALSAAARLVCYGACCAAVLRLRWPERRIVTLFLPAAGTILAVLLITMLPPRDLLLAAAAPLAGTLIYFAAPRS